MLELVWHSVTYRPDICTTATLMLMKSNVKKKSSISYFGFLIIINFKYYKSSLCKSVT